MKSKLELPGDGPELTAALKRIAELEAALRALLKGCERYDNNPDSAVAGAAYDAGMDAARKALGT